MNMNLYFVRENENLLADERAAKLSSAWQPERRDPGFFYETNDEVFSFMVSRHPFERILSAYRFKNY